VENDGCRVVRQQQDGLPAKGVTSLAVARNGDLWVGMWAGLSRRHDP
jgi:ligand-binding sensor domain-containing protein